MTAEIEHLQRRMEAAAEALDFEEARRAPPPGWRAPAKPDPMTARPAGVVPK